MRKHGFTSVELMYGATITALVIGGVATLMSGLNRMTGRSVADYTAKEVLHRATSKMAPLIRSAMIVNPASDSTHLILEEPVQNQDGTYPLPLQAGDEIEFYLSDSTGSMNATGTVLWEADDGVPDKNFAYMGSTPNVDIGHGSIQFTYLPDAADPSEVQISVTTTQTSLPTTLTSSINSVVALRNHTPS